MLNIDVEIERISNGYIVTNNDDSCTKQYYSTLVEFSKSQFEEYMADQDRYFKEHDADGSKLIFKASLTENSD